MNLFVPDASVVAKWFLPPAEEPLTAEARALLRKFAQGELDLIVPDLFWAELGSILWKAVRTGRFQSKAASEALASVLDYSLPTRGAQELIHDALAIALAVGCTVYDAIYLALAIQQEAIFVTADERLPNRLPSHWPVRWLGTYA